MFNKVNAARTNLQNGQADPLTWNDPTLRDAENFAAAGSDAAPYGYAAHNSFGTAGYQYLLKQYFYPLIGEPTTGL
jgi:ABC-type molybdate transport system substrate-binding protein